MIRVPISEPAAPSFSFALLFVLDNVVTMEHLVLHAWLSHILTHNSHARTEDVLLLFVPSPSGSPPLPPKISIAPYLTAHIRRYKA